MSEDKDLKKRKEEWKSKFNASSKRDADFTTVSGMEVPELATPEDLGEISYLDDIGFPGEYPYTRGVYSSMYRGRLWTMRQFAGFGSPEDTNNRFKFLMKQGQTGLSTAFDMPALMGYDCDNSRSRGEVGKEGVSVSSLRDMEDLFSGIDLGKVSVSMTINCTASIVFAMYLVLAEKKGIKPERLRGTIQNDMLKEFIAQREWISPPQSSVKIVVDMIEYCTKYVPNCYPVSVSGYHIREAGSTAVQELAFTLADGIGYVRECIERGMKIDDFASRLSFFFNSHNDFFEEIAKFRAARRMWANIMRENFGATDPKSMMLKMHTQTAGCSLTAQQPVNNVVRVAIQALAAVLGGTQSLHTNSMDETLSLPTEESVLLALRTQQVIAEESGVVNSVDPLGGSYLVENLTNRVERDAYGYIDKIDEMGGIIKAIESGYPQKEIADASYKYQKQFEKGEKTIVGVNKYKMENRDDMEIHKFDELIEQKQIEKLSEVKRTRDNRKVKKCLSALSEAAHKGHNLVPFLIDAVREYSTIGEISDVYRDVYGEYKDPGLF